MSSYSVAPIHISSLLRSPTEFGNRMRDVAQFQMRANTKGNQGAMGRFYAVNNAKKKPNVWKTDALKTWENNICVPCCYYFDMDALLRLSHLGDILFRRSCDIEHPNWCPEANKETGRTFTLTYYIYNNFFLHTKYQSANSCIGNRLKKGPLLRYKGQDNHFQL